MAGLTTERQRLNTLLFYAVVLLLGYLAYRIVAPFLTPLLWAGILALCAQPLHRRLTPRCGRNVAALASTAAMSLLLIVPAVALILALFGEVSQALAALQGVIGDVRDSPRLGTAWTWIQAHIPLPTLDDLRGRLAGLAEELTRFLAGRAGAIVQSTSLFAFELFVTLFALFFFLRDGPQLGAVIRTILPFEKKRKEELMARTRDLVLAGAMATLVVAALQGLVGGVLFAIIGLRAPVFWGVVMGFCALLPLFGTALVWGPAALWLFMTGAWIKGLVLVGLGITLVAGLDNALRPALLSGKAAMNGLVVFISMLGGVAAFGFAGLVLGPVVAAAVTSLLQLGVVEPEADREDDSG